MFFKYSLSALLDKVQTNNCFSSNLAIEREVEVSVKSGTSGENLTTPCGITFKKNKTFAESVFESALF